MKMPGIPPMPATRRTAALGLACFVLAAAAETRAAPEGQEAEAWNMRLVGAHGLGGRGAYQPVIKRRNGRYIAYIGHHSWRDNGVSILDVTDPKRPRYLTHMPSSGGAQMVQVCGGGELPRGDRAKTYLLRTRGSAAHEIWDVTEPARPQFVITVAAGLSVTHKNWWECGTGIAYLMSDLRPDGWSTSRGMQVFDLSDPARPRFIRNFGLAGSEPGGRGTGTASAAIHEATSDGKRVYVAYGTSSNGVLQIIDREKLLDTSGIADPRRPSAGDLVRLQTGRFDMASHWGGHTAWPLTGMTVRPRPGAPEETRDFVVLVSEALRGGCRDEAHHMAWFVDVTDAGRPKIVSSFRVPERPGDFCRRGGRFGAHSLNWSFTAPFYRRIVVFSYFNAGARAVDVRDPYHPREVAHYIPAANAGSRVAQTNNVEVDDRGLIYLVDRAGGGLHIVELTGAARRILE